MEIYDKLDWLDQVFITLPTGFRLLKDDEKVSFFDICLHKTGYWIQVGPLFDEETIKNSKVIGRKVL